MPIDRPLPSIFFSCGIHDSRVPYWEPLKFIAKLRSLTKASKEKNPILIRVNERGHFITKSSETAEWITFVINA